MVAAFFKGLSIDKYEIRPGQSNQLKFMSRFTQFYFETNEQDRRCDARRIADPWGKTVNLEIEGRPLYILYVNI